MEVAYCKLDVWSSMLPIGLGRQCKVPQVICLLLFDSCLFICLHFFSSPERPGIVERSTFLMDEDDLTCRVHDVTIAEDGLVGAASIMMFITVAYIGK